MLATATWQSLLTYIPVAQKSGDGVATVPALSFLEFYAARRLDWDTR